MKKRIQDNIYRLIENTSSGWKTNNIFIVGKGPSIDELSGFELPGGLVINLNDSEKIFQGQIGVFSANWVRHSLKDRGFKCLYYLAGKPLPDEVPHDVLPAVPLEYDDEDLTTFRLGMDDFYDESFVLTNALKVCRVIANQHKICPNVYLLGFDFSTEKGEISKHLGLDYAKNEVERSLVVHSQENSYLQFVQYFNDNPLINLIHVGTKAYSQLTYTQFRQQFTPDIRVAEKDRAKSEQVTDRVLIVAELTNNHLGNVDRMVEMVERAKEAGADLIKVQKRDVDSFYSKEKLSSYYWSPFGKTLRDYRMGVELDDEKLDVLDKTCKALGINWFSSVLDLPSFKKIQRFSPEMIKIPSTISNHREFHQQVASSYEGTVVISTGFTDEAYETYVLETFKRNKTIYLLHCTSAYPTARQDCNVSVVGHYAALSKQYPTVIPGYSSHDLGSLASVLAVASGARMVEKHVKLGDVEWVHFDKVALDLKRDEFKKFVHDIREAELLLGSPRKKILEAEHHKYEVVTKK